MFGKYLDFFHQEILHIYDVLNEIYLQNFSQIGANLRAESNEPNLIMTRYNNNIVTIL